MRINEAVWLEKYGRWQIKVQKEGVRKTFTSYTKGKKGKIECERKADKFLENGITTDNVRFNKAYEEFLEDTKLLTGTPNYKKHLSIGTNWLLPFLANKRVSLIKSYDYQNCINAAYKKGLSKKTLINIRGTITVFIAFCRRKGYEVANYIDIIIPKDAPKKEKAILQPEQLKKLLSLTEKDNDYIFAFQFFVATGLRRGELCALQLEDIKNNIVHIQRSINSIGEITDGKTKNANRYFKLYGLSEQILQKQIYLKKSKGIISPFVFPNFNTGKMLNPQYLFAQWSKFRKTLGVDCSIHELRHTFISITKSDVPDELLKMVVGHSKTMDTFGIYGHTVDGDMERAASMIDTTLKRLVE